MEAVSGYLSNIRNLKSKVYSPETIYLQSYLSFNLAEFFAS